MNQPAPADPLPAWEDPRVQIVYTLLCADEAPPDREEHWEGWIARRIVAALAAKPAETPTPRGALTQGTIDMLRREADHPTESAKPAETPAAESDEWLRWDADVLKRNLDQLGAPTDIEGCLLSPWGRVEVLLKETQRSSNATRSDEQTSPSVQPPAPEPPSPFVLENVAAMLEQRAHRPDGNFIEVAKFLRALAATPSIAQRGAALRSALETLLAEQNGPPLLKHAARWQAAVDQAVAALALSPEDAGKPEVR